MSQHSITCDDERLRTLLRDGSAKGETDSQLEHVENCEYCQQRLSELAASEEEWRTAAEALSETPARVAPAPQQSHRCEQPVAWTESIARQLLLPPSHPENLGRLGRYEVERLIGAGGMGVVFKAYDEELNRPVAIKVLAPYLAGSGAARRRFEREARAAAAVVHQHVVPIHNVEIVQEIPFLVMYYVAGESLQSRIDREAALELCEDSADRNAGRIRPRSRPSAGSGSPGH